jgi:hypothetical protein
MSGLLLKVFWLWYRLLTAHQRCQAWIRNIASAQQKHTLTCIFLLQSDAQRPDPGRVSPLLLLPSQHKAELTKLAGTTGGLHCRRAGESPSNEMKEVHVSRYCSHALNWVWHRSGSVVMFRTSISQTVHLTASHDPIFNVIIPPPCHYRGSKFINFATHSEASDLKFRPESRLPWLRDSVIFSSSSTRIPG